MTHRQLILLATFGSIALLGGAFVFQIFGGLAPCKLCLWQRWPHGAAILVGIVYLVTARPSLAWLGMCAALTTAGIGLYHTGVELSWWQGPTTCTSSSVSGLSTDELLEQILKAPLARCDEIAWSLFGLSMAAWNAILSFLIALIWLRAAIEKD